MAGDPRVWIGKGDRPCRLVVTCSGCGKPAFVTEPDGAQMAACPFCGMTEKASDEAASAWGRHKSVCKCGVAIDAALAPGVAPGQLGLFGGGR
jgi:hypothetical protein